MHLVDGNGVAQSDRNAFIWFKKSAGQGLAPSQLRLGLCYYRGVGVGKDDSLAAEWFKKAAEQGDPDAQQCLNEILEDDSKARGIKKNPPDEDAAERILVQIADYLVQGKIDSGSLIAARRLGVQFQYIQGNPECDANAQVDYEFTFTTEAGLTRRNNGFLFFYHDPKKRDWFNSQTDIDGIPPN